MNKASDGLGTQIFVDSINGHGLNDVYIRVFVVILFLIAIDKRAQILISRELIVNCGHLQNAVLKGIGSLIHSDMQQWLDILGKKKKGTYKLCAVYHFCVFKSVGGNVYANLGRIQLYLSKGHFLTL